MGQALGVSRSITLQQPVSLELAQVVAQLVKAIVFFREMEGGEDGMVDLLGGRSAEMGAAVQENFKEADDAWVVELDAWITNRADGDREGEALQEREVDMDIEPLRLEAGEAAGDGLEPPTDGIEMV